MPRHHARLLSISGAAAAALLCAGCVVAPLEPVPVAGPPVVVMPPPVAVVPGPYLGPPPVTYAPFYAPGPVVRGPFWGRPHWHGHPGHRHGHGGRRR